MPRFFMLREVEGFTRRHRGGTVSPVDLVMRARYNPNLGQAILFRGAGLDVIWPQFLTLTVVGSVLFLISLNRFRRTISQMA
jgi:hypothetical protein